MFFFYAQQQDVVFLSKNKNKNELRVMRIKFAKLLHQNTLTKVSFLFFPTVRLSCCI